MDQAVRVRLDPGEATMTLPWKPIAELPVGPDAGREFVVVGPSQRLLISWVGSTWVHRGSWDQDSDDSTIRNAYSRFIEITPP